MELIALASWILLGSMVILVVGAVITQRFVYTPTFRNAEGEVLPGSIAQFIRLRLGGNRQGVLIRGRCLDNPVLLYLHPGPGLSVTGMMRNFNSVLEDHFTMVYLDQRGGGKSYSPFNKRASITTEQLLDDIHELTLYLKARFGKEKILIMGHSFGAGFSALAAARYPEDYSVCVNIAQPVCPVECDRLSHPVVLDLARMEGNQKAIAELEKVEGFWLSEEKDAYFSGMMTFKKWVSYYGGQVFGQESFFPFVLNHQWCREFTVFDWIPYFLGMSFVGNASWEIMRTTDLRKQASVFKIPFVILEGRHDINTHPPLVETYFEMIRAPYKRIYWFERSAHFPNFEEPLLFQKIMIDEILPLAQDD